MDCPKSACPTEEPSTANIRNRHVNRTPAAPLLAMFLGNGPPVYNQPIGRQGAAAWEEAPRSKSWLMKNIRTQRACAGFRRDEGLSPRMGCRKWKSPPLPNSREDIQAFGRLSTFL
jgi:hypothetical protein